MFEKSFNVQGSMALTLSADEVGSHQDGWCISGAIHEDYYQWVNDFEAFHPVFGRVWGNFEDKVFADSEAGFDAFYASHPPESWDYYDI